MNCPDTNDQKNCRNCDILIPIDGALAFLEVCSSECLTMVSEKDRAKATARVIEEYEKSRREIQYKQFYQSPRWLTLRWQALQKFGFRCMACRRGREDSVILHVDHIKPRSKHPELELDINNLQVLCADCNLGKSNRSDEDLRP